MQQATVDSPAADVAVGSEEIPIPWGSQEPVNQERENDDDLADDVEEVVLADAYGIPYAGRAQLKPTLLITMHIRRSARHKRRETQT